MESMESDEESRMIMPKAQPTASELEIDESSRALDERSHHGANKPIWDLYANTNLCAAVRCLFSIPMLGSAARIVASTEPISTVFPFAAYALGCAILHVLLAAHRTVRPRSLTSALPSQLYMTILAISPAALLAASLYGFTVLAMTREHYDERDPQGELVRCGSKYGSRKCRPKTHAADIYDMTIVCTSFAFAALCCSLAQCYHIFRLCRNSYTKAEIKQACMGAVTTRASFWSIMKDAMTGSYKRARKAGNAS